MKNVFTSLMFGLTFVTGSNLYADSPSDSELIQSAQYAMEEGKDCTVAGRLLDRVTQTGRQSASFAYLRAQALECVGGLDNLKLALDWYRKYESVAPRQIGGKSKSAELNYKILRSQGN